MAPLQRALPDADPHRLLRDGRQDLHLEVLRLVQVALQVDVPRPEVGLGLPDGRFERTGNVPLRPGNLEAAAPASPRRLDRHRVPVLPPEGHHPGLVGVQPQPLGDAVVVLVAGTCARSGRRRNVRSGGVDRERSSCAERRARVRAVDALRTPPVLRRSLEVEADRHGCGAGLADVQVRRC